MCAINKFYVVKLDMYIVKNPTLSTRDINLYS